MTGASPTVPTRMPSVGRLLTAQISYQARLLASGRAVTIGVVLPVILLIDSHTRHSQTTPADVAQYAVFGLSLTAWNTFLKTTGKIDKDLPALSSFAVAGLAGE